MAEIRINATGGVKLYDADDSHYAQIIAGTITSNVDVLTLGHASADFNIPVKVLGTTPTLTIGDAGAEDTKIVFDGNAQDYYIYCGRIKSNGWWYISYFNNNCGCG